LAAALVVAGIVLGSRGLKDFDTALVPYAGATVFAAFGLAYRYVMWLQRPPTRLYWFRGWQIFLQPSRLPANLFFLLRRLFANFVAQSFIARRGVTRWAAHWLIFWGCILAALVTFPLSFGWIRFETVPGSQETYRAFVFGLPVFHFPLSSPIAPLVFNVLDIAAVLVLAGIGIAMWRRARDRGALAVQQLSSDLMPLFLLFAICVTGLLLTVSTHAARGYHYGFLSEFHAVTVIFTLLYLPFGKFFHIFQRPAQLSIEFYRRASAAGPQAACARCGLPFAGRLHVEDLKRVEDGLRIRFAAAHLHYQDVCPPCRRKLLAVTQDGLWRERGRPRPEAP
jgi:nitrate reductase gamma subunit